LWQRDADKKKATSAESLIFTGDREVDQQMFESGDEAQEEAQDQVLQYTDGQGLNIRLKSEA